MIEWTDRPKDDPTAHSLPLVRCPSGSNIWGFITAPALIGCHTHYWHGRTLPCSQPDCPACADGFPWRWHGYISLLRLPVHQHVILELTAQAVEPITKWKDQGRQILGAKMQAKRIGQRKNARVQVQMAHGDSDKIVMPDPPNLIAALSIIWCLPKTQMHDTRPVKQQPAIIRDANPLPDSLRPHEPNGRPVHAD